MRILIVHNHYGDFAFGGEAMVMKAESELLRSYGHDVFIYERTNSEIFKRSLWGKIKAFKDMTWSPEGYKAVADVIDEFKPDIMHVHNYKFLLSPSIFKAAKDRGVATCLTLHNYRLACPAGQFLCNGRICEDCLDGFPYRMLWRQCIPGSFLANVVQLYLYIGTRKRKLLAPWIDAYIALSEFGRNKFIEGGLPADKVFVKPNFMSDPINGQTANKDMHGAIFVGRLSKEKGVAPLLNAWKDIEYPLTIVGDGPLRDGLEKSAPDNVRFVGFKSHQEVLALIVNSAFMIFPSEWYEGFPLSLLEAMAIGRPVIASDLGPRHGIVRDGKTGLLFKAGDPDDLRQKVQRLINHPHECEQMGEAARKEYLQKYTPEKNYKMLMDVYYKLVSQG